MGATVRNFGQVVPSGMNLKWQNFGRESLKIYKEIQSEFDLTVRQHGSVYLASNSDEEQLINELHQINKNQGYSSVLLTQKQCIENYDGVKKNYCKAGLFFPEEITVEPRAMVHQLHKYIKAKFDVKLFYNHTVISIDEMSNKLQVQTTNGLTFESQKVIVCGGSEFQLLYPDLYASSDLEVSKLQMLQTKKQPNSYRLNGSILTGLTIRRYESFTECPSWNSIKAKEDQNTFEKKYGIHILFKQASDGSVIIGDSHEYANAKNKDVLGIDSKDEIDSYMIQEAKKIIDLPDYDIQYRWTGMYSQCKHNDIFDRSVGENIHLITGIGGKGMTGSAGFSKHKIDNIL